MATYAEMQSLRDYEPLRDRVRIACLVAADTIVQEAGSTANHANRMLWAKSVYQNPVGTANDMYWAVVIRNKGSTLTQIQTASDAAVQTAVDAMVNTFAQ